MMTPEGKFTGLIVSIFTVMAFLYLAFYIVYDPEPDKSNYVNWWLNTGYDRPQAKHWYFYYSGQYLFPMFLLTAMMRMIYFRYRGLSWMPMLVLVLLQAFLLFSYWYDRWITYGQSMKHILFITATLLVVTSILALNSMKK